jgi:HK97 family phage major capsid protein
VLERAYSKLEIKSLDEDQRIITGLATSPSTDRAEDVVESDGAEFSLPMPFLSQHKRDQPIGEIFSAKRTPAGIEISARILKIQEPGLLKDRLDLAWQEIKYKLVRGLSIGMRPKEVEPIKGTYGLRFKRWEWLETSAVTIPANVEASIQTIKSVDAGDLAASGKGAQPKSVGSAGATAHVTGRSQMGKTIAEQIKGYEAQRQGKLDSLAAIMQKSLDEGVTLNTEQKEEADGLEADVKGLDEHIVRLKRYEDINKASAAPVSGTTTDGAAASRETSRVISFKSVEDPGIGFARLCKVKAVAHLSHRYVLDVAKEMYPSDDRLRGHFEKASVLAGTTTNSVNAAVLVDPMNLASEFIEYLRADTIIGKFGRNGIPGLNAVPFNIRVTGRTTGGTGYWVGEGAPKPLTAFEYNVTTLAYTKVAAISVITQELARFASPSADRLTRDGLRAALIERIDIDFIDPTSAAVANVQPASITNGLTPLSPSGTTADAARADLANLLSSFIESNQDPTGLVLIMPATLALSLSLLRNSLGQPEFNGLTMRGGMLEGIPVIVSQYAANASGAGNLVIAVNTREVFLADDGEVTVDASTEASLQMLDNPTNNSATATATTMVSMFQTNSIALRAERFINWAKRRAAAVVYMDDVNWGSIGSPS